MCLLVPHAQSGDGANWLRILPVFFAGVISLLSLLTNSAHEDSGFRAALSGGVVAAMRALRARVKPDPEGWTRRDYVPCGRRSMPLVVDASVAPAWALPDEINTSADAVFAVVERDGFGVAELWAREIANGLAVACLGKRITPADENAFLLALSSLSIDVQRTRSRRNCCS